MLLFYGLDERESTVVNQFLKFNKYQSIRLLYYSSKTWFKRIYTGVIAELRRRQDPTNLADNLVNISFHNNKYQNRFFNILEILGLLLLGR